MKQSHHHMRVNEFCFSGTMKLKEIRCFAPKQNTSFTADITYFHSTLGFYTLHMWCASKSFFFSVSHLILLHTVVLHSAVSGQESCECRSEESDVLREAVSWLWWVLFEVVCVDVSCGEEGLPLPCCVYWVWWVTRLGWWTEQCCSLQQCVTKPLMLTQSFIVFFLPSSNTLLADTQSLRVTVQRNYLGISDRIAEMKISHPINL